jgi:hypothetical protein
MLFLTLATEQPDPAGQSSSAFALRATAATVILLVTLRPLFAGLILNWISRSVTGTKLPLWPTVFTSLMAMGINYLAKLIPYVEQTSPLPMFIALGILLHYRHAVSWKHSLILTVIVAAIFTVAMILIGAGAMALILNIYDK